MYIRNQFFLQPLNYSETKHAERENKTVEQSPRLEMLRLENLFFVSHSSTNTASNSGDFHVVRGACNQNKNQKHTSVVA